MILTGGALGLSPLSGCSGRGKRYSTELNFYNYSDYIARDTIPNFEQEFNTRVNYDLYSNQEILFAKIKIGVTGYDLVVASDIIVKRFIKQNLLMKLEPEKIPNANNLMSRFQRPDYDPDHAYSLPYLWGTTVVAYNKKYVKEPALSWELLWDERYKGKITMLDEKRDSIGCTLISLGYSGNETSDSRIAEAKKKLLEQRPLIKKYTSDYQDLLITNEAWICQAWSGDVIQAQGNNENIDFFIPEEGSFLWVDNMCIPQGAPHPEAAREFINYVLRPEVGAKIASAVGYPTPNRLSYDIIRETDPESAKDTRIYPTEETMKKLEFFQDIGEHEQAWSLVWEDVKLGRS